MEKSKMRRWIQAALALAIVVAAVNVARVFFQRHESPLEQKQETTAEPRMPSENYVAPRKIYAYDLKSAKTELTAQPVWMKEGYRYTFFPLTGKRPDLAREAGLLGPIEKLEIKDVITAPTPGASGQRQVLAVFDKEGKSYVVPVGIQSGSNAQIYANEMFFIQDPHELYNAWPREVWDAIDRHEVKPGMNELQASFAIGMGVPKAGDPQNKVVKYPNGGQPLTITYRNGKAAEIEPGA